MDIREEIERKRELMKNMSKKEAKKVAKKEKKMEKLDKQIQEEGEQLGAKKEQVEQLKKADVNGDGKVDEQDLSIVHKEFAKESKKKVVKKED